MAKSYKIDGATPSSRYRNEGELPSLELLEQRQEERMKKAKETPVVATESRIRIDVPDAAKRGDVSLTGKRKRTEGIEDSSTRCEEASSGDEQGDQGDLAEGSQEGQNKDPLGPMDGRTVEKGGQELVGQLLDIPEHTHEEPASNPYRDQEGSTKGRSRTDIPRHGTMPFVRRSAALPSPLFTGERH
ncbi:hypothetical protein M9H77_23905 [Catharanthus roseus]|uniref:Uncharacterized protein n=1 Tax=Catharanthus roseus TaxID=4058 RepID=A0ACC0AVU8_CATRO|nr:hypothetical protein M9H77_23905 [Catharanthus roseus]